MTTIPVEVEVVTGPGVKIEPNEAGQLVLTAEPVDNDARNSAQQALDGVTDLNTRVPDVYAAHQIIMWDTALDGVDKYGQRSELYTRAHYIGPTDPVTLGRDAEDGDLWTKTT